MKKPFKEGCSWALKETMETRNFISSYGTAVALVLLVIAGCDTTAPPDSVSTSSPGSVASSTKSIDPGNKTGGSSDSGALVALRPCEPLTGKKLLADLSALDPVDWTFVNPADIHPRKDCEGQMVSSQPPVYAPLGDGKHFVLAHKLRYRLGPNKRPIFVPRGFVTDLTSIPPAFWSLLPRDGNYVSAAIVHDYLYWDQRCTRAQADIILRNEMVEFGVDKKKVWSIYTAVNRGGERAWNKNTVQKKTRIRVIPQDYLDRLLEGDLNASRTLEALEREMLQAGVTPMPDAQNPNMAEICIHAAIK